MRCDTERGIAKRTDPVQGGLPEVGPPDYKPTHSLTSWLARAPFLAIAAAQRHTALRGHNTPCSNLKHLDTLTFKVRCAHINLGCNYQ